jgi:hypothetical protein
MTHCQVKGTGCGTVWHIAMWKALAMVPYDTLSGERHWLWYCMTHCHVRQCVIRYHGQCNMTMRHTATHPVYFIWQCDIRYHDQCLSPGWHIARWKALVVVLHDTLPCERHWLWYCMTYCHVKGTSYGTVWHIAMWKAPTNVFQLTLCYTVSQPEYFTWQCIMRYHNQCISPVNVPCGTTTSAFHLAMYHTLPCTGWHIAKWKALVMVPYDTLPGERHWLWYCMTHCHVKGTGCGTVWHIAMWKALVMVPYDTLPCWQCVIRYHD